MKFDYCMPVRIVSGSGCVRSFDGYARLGRKCLIVAGKHLHRTSAVFPDLYAGLTRCGVQYELFAQVENNPSVETAFAAVQAARRCNADFIVGVGGGSAMDAAKVAALLYANPGVQAQDIFDPAAFSRPPIPLILIGTTAGTGSEVTAVGVLTVISEGGILKRSVKTPYSYADFALCDPVYTETLPPAVTVATALDSISHAVEAFCSQTCGLFEREYALLALRTVMPALRRYLQQGADSLCRQELYTGSLFAGMAINGAGTNFAHSMGYQLTNYLGYAHGIACAVILPQLLNDETLLDAMGLPDVQSAEDFIYESIRSVITPVRLTTEQCEQFAELAMKMPSLNKHVFTPYTFEECVHIYALTSQKLADGRKNGKVEYKKAE